MYTYKTADKTLEFVTQEGVFFPTDTSELLIAGALKTIRKPGRTLDLGCGVGVLGLTLAKSGLVEGTLCASDLSPEAVRLAGENAKRHGVSMDARVGSLFEPWHGRVFDCIVEDVPGITEEVAAFSRWFPKSIPCASGLDGAELAVRVIREAPLHLSPGGTLIFPILSLSDTDRLLDAAQGAFENVVRVQKRLWSLPEEMRPHMDFLMKLKAEKKVRLEEKFGLVLWYTEVYAASGAKKTNKEAA